MPTLVSSDEAEDTTTMSEWLNGGARTSGEDEVGVDEAAGAEVDDEGDVDTGDGADEGDVDTGDDVDEGDVDTGDGADEGDDGEGDEVEAGEDDGGGGGRHAAPKQNISTTLDTLPFVPPPKNILFADAFDAVAASK